MDAGTQTTILPGSRFCLDIHGVLRTVEARDKQCGDKVPHPSLDQAYSACISLYLTNREETEPYECPFCGWTHIGHPIGYGRRRRKALKRMKLQQGLGKL